MAIGLLVLLVLMVPTVDSRDLTSAITGLQNDVKSLKSKTALLEQQSYFKATFSAATPKVEPGTVVFDKVTENIGSGYNPSSGVFTAPAKGLYIFTVQVFSNGAGLANWDLHRNGQIAMRFQSTSQDSTSQSYMHPMILNNEDKVSVQNRNAIDVWGTNHSFFSGSMLKALP